MGEMKEKETNKFQAEEIDLKSILFKYLRYWYLFVIGVIIFVTIAFFHLRYVTPLYNISSTLLIKDYRNGPDMFGNAAFHDLELFNTFKNIKNEIQILKSPDLMEEVLSELEMKASFYVEGNVKTSELYGRKLPVKVLIHELDSSAFGKMINLHIQGNNGFELSEAGNEIRSSHLFGQEIKKPYGKFTVLASSGVAQHNAKSIQIQFNDTRRLANYYSQKLNVTLVDQDASVLQISMTDAVPEKGEDIITKLVQVYNREAVEDKNQIAANTIDFIDDRLISLTSELSEVEKEVEQYKRHNALTNVSSEANLYLERASKYNHELAELEIQLDILKSIEGYLDEQENQFELVPSSLNLQDPTLYGLITRFNELQLERDRMLRTTQPDNPIVQDMNEQLVNLRMNILENIKNIQKGMLISRKKLQASSTRFESRIQQVPSIERELLEISRQQGIKQGLYLYLLQKREEAALSLAATAPSSRIIVEARAGDFPINSKKQLIYILAIALGIGIPIVFVFAKEILNDKVQERKDIEKATNTPILGEIAHKKGGDTLVMTQESKTPVAELFRLVRTNLQFATAGKENKVILVTSSMSGEGKTFFSINLAASLALIGKKTVVLDFDFRKPRVASNLGLSNNLGITNYLISEKYPVEEVIKPSGLMENLFIAGSGPVPPNPAELMQLPRIGELISTLKKSFDHIIIDTSPVGQVADALSMEPYVDSSLYVVRYNYTLHKHLNIIDDIYNNQKLKYPMIVLNDARKDNGYGYGYGYGYEEKPSWKERVKQKLKF